MSSSRGKSRRKGKPAEPPGEGSRLPLRTVPRLWTLSLLLFVTCFSVYVANGRTRAAAMAGDTGSNRLVPFSLLRFGTVSLEPFRASFVEHGGLRWFARERRGRLMPNYPLGSALVALPFYLPLYAGLVVAGRTSADDLFFATPWCEKVAASGIAASVVVAVFLVLARRVSPGRAAGVAATLGLCTLLWPVASQLLWQHGPGALVLTLGFLALDRRPTPAMALLAGLLFGLLLIVRPLTLPFAAVAGLAVLAGSARPLHDRLRSGLAYATGLLALALPLLAYNLYFFGHPLGVYGGGEVGSQWLLGPLGLLVSPNRGLLVFMPIAGLGLLGAARSVRQWRTEPLLALMLLAGLGYFLVHAWALWWAGGWSFGPRYLVELLPLLAIAAAEVRIAPWARPLVALAWLLSLFVQATGAFVYPTSNWHGRLGEDLQAAAWDWHHVMLWEDWQAWLAGVPRPDLP